MGYIESVAAPYPYSLACKCSAFKLFKRSCLEEAEETCGGGMTPQQERRQHPKSCAGFRQKKIRSNTNV